MGNDLVNCKGEKKYHDDQYHLELKDAKLGVDKKEEEACYLEYVILTKDDFPKINQKFEKTLAKKVLDPLRKKKGIMTDEEYKKK